MAKKKTEENPSTALVKKIEGDGLVQQALTTGRSWLDVESIVDPVVAKECKTALDRTKDAIDIIEARRKEFTDPLNKVIKFFNNAARPWREELEQYEEHQKTLLRDHEALIRAESLKAAEREAKKYDKKGATQIADEIRREAIEQKVFDGARSQRKAKIVDLHAFLRAALESPALLDMVEVKMPMLNALAKATKGASEIPGVEFYSETVFSRGRGES